MQYKQQHLIQPHPWLYNLTENIGNKNTKVVQKTNDRQEMASIPEASSCRKKRAFQCYCVIHSDIILIDYITQVQSWNSTRS